MAEALDGVRIGKSVDDRDEAVDAGGSERRLALRDGIAGVPEVVPIIIDSSSRANVTANRA